MGKTEQTAKTPLPTNGNGEPINQERWHPYYEAFYGPGFPMSQVGVRDHTAFREMCNLIKSDIEATFPQLEDEAVKKKAILAALRALWKAKAEHPKAYKTPIYGREAGFAAASTVHRELSVSRTKEYINKLNAVSEERYKALENEPGNAINFYALFDAHFQKNVEKGIEPHSAKVAAYIQVIEANPHPEGFNYYVLAMKLPNEQGIYDEPEVIKAHQDHPSFRKLERTGPTKMMVNGRKWNPTGVHTTKPKSLHLRDDAERKHIDSVAKGVKDKE